MDWSHHKRQIFLYLHAAHMFRNARSMCEFVRVNLLSELQPAYTAMMTGVVVNYAKPFANNSGFGQLPGSFRKFEKSELKWIHDRLLEARDRLYAHLDIAGPMKTEGRAYDVHLHVRIRDGERHFWPRLYEYFIKTESIGWTEEACTLGMQRAEVESQRLVRELMKDGPETEGNYDLVLEGDDRGVVRSPDQTPIRWPGDPQ